MNPEEPNTILIYFLKKNFRIVRAVEKISLLDLQFSTIDVQSKIITIFSDKMCESVLATPSDYIFHNVFGLQKQIDDNIDNVLMDLYNLRLSYIEVLWKIANIFLKNTVMQYTYNQLVFETLNFEKIHENQNEIDSLTEFIRQKENIDSKSFKDLVNLRIDHVYEKRKNILKNILDGQEVIMSSEDPKKTFIKVIQSIYIKY